MYKMLFLYSFRKYLGSAYIHVMDIVAVNVNTAPLSWGFHAVHANAES